MTMWRALLTSLGLALVLGACNGEEAAEPDAADGDGEVITVEVGDMYFEPDTVEVAAGEPITFELLNEGSSEHDLVFGDGRESDTVAPGETVTFAAGEFDRTTLGWCSLPGHRDAGMELEVVIE